MRESRKGAKWRTVWNEESTYTGLFPIFLALQCFQPACISISFAVFSIFIQVSLVSGGFIAKFYCSRVAFHQNTARFFSFLFLELLRKLLRSAPAKRASSHAYRGVCVLFPRLFRPPISEKSNIISQLIRGFLPKFILHVVQTLLVFKLYTTIASFFSKFGAFHHSPKCVVVCNQSIRDLITSHITR